MYINTKYTKNIMEFNNYNIDDIDNKFNSYNIDKKIILSLNKIGIKSPTPVQKKAIPLIKENNNIIVESGTGTGKTMSFLIPIVDRSMRQEITNTLILAPTRELVIQIHSELSKLINKIDDNSKLLNLNLLAIYGGKNIDSQISKLKNNKNYIIIATPGRLIDHVHRNTIDISNIDMFVIDEADQMILMGFRNEIDFIFSKIKKIKQVLMFSATIDSKVKKMAYHYADNFKTVSINNSDMPNTITQKFIFTTDRNKFDDLCDTIEKDPPFMAIIFCRTKVRVDNLELKLAQNGFNCKKIHSDLSQSKRERIMKEFRNLKIQFLISTDLSARGLDIDGVTHIYNYDFPERAEDYIHRIGRTGRIGKDGVSYSFVTEKNKNIYEEVIKINNQ